MIRHRIRGRISPRKLARDTVYPIGSPETDPIQFRFANVFLQTFGNAWNFGCTKPVFIQESLDPAYRVRDARDSSVCWVLTSKSAQKLAKR